jgi:hypothetical protein
LDSLIPSHIGHIQAQAESYEPGTNQVVLNDGSKVSYDYLVVAPGLKLSMSNSAFPSGLPIFCVVAEGDEEEEGKREMEGKELMIDFGNVKGLQSALEDPFKSNVSTIYNYENSEKTWQLIEKFKGEGGAIFTQPQGIIKCAGGMSISTPHIFLQVDPFIW